MTTAVTVSNHGGFRLSVTQEERNLETGEFDGTNSNQSIIERTDTGEVQYYIHSDRRIIVQEIPDAQ